MLLISCEINDQRHHELTTLPALKLIPKLAKVVTPIVSDHELFRGQLTLITYGGCEAPQVLYGRSASSFTCDTVHRNSAQGRKCGNRVRYNLEASFS